MIGFTITPSHIDYSEILNDNVIDDLVMGECVILTSYAKEFVPIDTGQLKASVMWATKNTQGGLNEGLSYTTSGKQTKGKNAGKYKKKRVAKISAFNYIEKPNDDKTGYVGSHLEYAGAVEYGRSDMPGYPRQPYLRPAIDYSKEKREARRKRTIALAVKEAYNPTPKEPK